MTWCIINGRITPATEAAVPAQDRGFRYGDGVFETLAIQEGVPYQFDWHMARLAGGLSTIRIAFNVASLREHCRLLLKKNWLKDGLLRIQVTRGSGGRGYLPDGANATFVIETSTMPEISQKPVALWQSSHSKISARALPIQYKLCQGLNSTLARIEADEHGCAEALLLNERGQLCETASGNIFWFKNGTLYTPSLSCGILEGATRTAVIRLSPYPVSEVETGIKTFLKAEAVFITNTVWKTLAIGRLSPLETVWDSEKITAQFYQLLTEDRDGYCRAHHADWQ